MAIVMHIHCLHCGSHLDTWFSKLRLIVTIFFLDLINPFLHSNCCTHFGTVTYFAYFWVNPRSLKNFTKHRKTRQIASFTLLLYVFYLFILNSWMWPACVLHTPSRRRLKLRLCYELSCDLCAKGEAGNIFFWDTPLLTTFSSWLCRIVKAHNTHRKIYPEHTRLLAV